MRKLFSVLSSTLQRGTRGGLLLLSLLATTSLWAYDYDFEHNEIRYKITSNEVPYAVEIVGSYTNYATHITIPATVQYNGIAYSVTSIGRDAFYNCYCLTNINIPNSVINIGNNAFDGCSSLKSIIIPENIIRVGIRAFWGCSSLTTVTIPEHIEELGGEAFAYCSSLTSVIWNAKKCISGSGSYIFKGTPINSFVLGDSVEYIPQRLFGGIQDLHTIIIPENVTTICGNAFERCKGLTSIVWNVKKIQNNGWACDFFVDIKEQITSFTFGNNVENIPSHLCYEMCNLNTISIPNSVSSIEWNAFFGCSSLTSLNVPNSVTSIADGAFRNCTSISTLTIPDGAVSIGSKVFAGCSALKSVKVTASSIEDYCNNTLNYSLYKAGIDSVDRHLFVNGTEVTNIIIPNTISTIKEYAFYNFPSINLAVLPETVSRIGQEAFSNCPNLSSVNLSDGVKYIGRRAFSDCPSLTTIVLGDNITTIGEQAFENCISLDEIQLKSINPPAISHESITSLPTCYVPYGSLAAYKKSDWAAQVRKFVEEPINGYQIFYTSSDDKIVSPSITNAFNTTIFSNVYENGQGIITFDGPVHTIKTGAFLNCSTLTSITIPVSIEHIEDRAFANCSALGVVDVKCTTPPTLGEDVFTSAPTCYIPCGTNYLYEASAWNKQVGEFVVEDCEGKQIFYTTANGNIITPPTADLGANLIGNVYENGQGIMTFDGPVTKMAGFSDCATLTSITIPESVTSVGGACFKNCPKLTSIIWNAKRVVQIKWGGGTWLGASLPAYDMFEGVRSQITSFVFGESVEYIPDYLCYCMEKLTSVVVPNNVTAIGGGVFKGCTSLTYAKLSDQITDMPCLRTGDPYGGGYAYHGTFTNCSALTEVILPQNLLSVGAYAFKGCSSLPTVVIPESVLAIGDCAFYICTSLSSITIPKNVTSIGSDAFRECSSLTAITIPNSVTNIGQNAFYKCTSLSSVVWNARYCNDFLTTGSYPQPSGPFYGCPITSFTIGEDVDILPAALCHGMSDIQSIIIPNSLRKIGDYAFSKCSSLNSITIPNSVTNIGQAAFDECSSLTTITIPEKVSKIGWGAFSNCASLKSVIWNAINTGDILTSSSYATTPFSSSPIETLVIGDKVTYVPQKLCYDCSTLTSVTIGKCVKEIGAYAFFNCTSLTKTNFKGSIGNWCSMTFGDMHSNPNYYSKSLHINGEEVKDIVIPNTVSSISNYAFYNCENISSVKIPESVKSIGSDAFGGCKKLFDIYCLPTTPPTAEESSFANYNVNLYVPCDNLRDYQMDMVFGSFKYIQCLDGDESSVEDMVLNDKSNIQKLLHDGQLLIIRDGKTYNVMGQEL